MSPTNTARLRSLYDLMSVGELVDRLAELEGRETVGWARDHKHRASVERRLVELLTRADAAEHGALCCQVLVRVRSALRVAPAIVHELHAGMMLLEIEPGWPAGTTVDIEVLELEARERGLVVRGVVDELVDGRLRVALIPQRDDRLRRFVLEAVRRRRWLD